MGVIRDLNSLLRPARHGDDIEDLFEAIQEEPLDIEEEPPRRNRRQKIRTPVKPQSTANGRSLKSSKKIRRMQNNDFLQTLTDENDADEITIYDFVSESFSAFAQLLMEKDSLQAWNDFINQSEEEQERYLAEAEIEDFSEKSSVDLDNSLDKRSDHPAFSAEVCFDKINMDLRSILRRRHVPLGTISKLEEDLTTFFHKKPNDVYKSQVPSSFERLMMHAVCQYMELLSKSVTENGVRWTKVRNCHKDFRPPTVMLSDYLENSFHKSQ